MVTPTQPRSGPQGPGEARDREPRQDARGGRSDDRRGGRGERPPRGGNDESEGTVPAADEHAPTQSFVDTMPNGPNGPNGPNSASNDGEGDSERTGNRRRNRRGGRGRDRNESVGGEGPAESATDATVDAAGHSSEPAPTRAGVDDEQSAAHETPAAEAGSVNAARDATGPAGDDGEMRGEMRGDDARPRRRRGGRGRGPREDAPELNGSDAGTAQATRSEEGAERTDGDNRIDRRADSSPAGETAQDGRLASFASATGDIEPSAPAAPRSSASFAADDSSGMSIRHGETPIGTEPADDVSAAVSSRAETVAEPVVETNYLLPIDSLQTIAQGVGLQWVNSDAEKIRTAQAAMAATPALVHVPREIRSPDRVDEGPLVLVETRKDLSQVRLPFETQGPAS